MTDGKPKGKRKRRWFRGLLVLFGGFLCLLFALWLFRIPLFGGLIRGAIAQALAEQGMAAEVDEIGGSFLGSFELRGLRIHEAPKPRLVTSASLDSARVSYSLLGLVRGRDHWIEEVTLDGLRAEIDLDAPLPPSGPDSPPSESDLPPLIPGRVRIRDVSITVRRGDERIVLTAGRLSSDAADGRIDGTFGADDFLVRAGGEDHRATAPEGAFRFADGMLRVDGLKANGKDHGQMLRVDLDALADARVDADLALPILRGRIEVTARLDLSGDHPAGRAEATLDGLDPGQILAFIPDLPAAVERIDGSLVIDLDGAGEPGLENATADFDLTLTRPAYDRWGVERVRAEGTLAGGRIEATLALTGPDLVVRGAADLNLPDGEPVIDATIVAEGFRLASLDLKPEGRGLSGVADVRGQAVGPVGALVFEAEVTVDSLRFGEYDADRIEISAAGTEESYEVRRFLLSRGEDRIEASGRLDLTEPLRFAGKASVLVNALEAYRDWLPEGVPQDLAGKIEVTARADGTPDEPDASLEVTLSNIVVAGNHVLSARIAGRAPRADRFQLDSIEVDGGEDLPSIRLGTVEIALDGGDVSVTATSLSVAHGEALLESCGELELGVRDGTTRLSVPLTCEGMEARLTAALDPEGGVEALLVTDRLPVGSIEEALGLEPMVEGLLTTRIVVGGTIEAPEIDIRVEIEEPVFHPPGLAAVPAKGLVVRARVGDGRAVLEEFALDGGAWSVEAEGFAPFDLDDPAAVEGADLSGEIRIRGLPLDVAGAPPGLASAAGVLNAELTVGGTASAPTLDGEISVKASEITLAEETAPAIEDLTLRVFLDALGPKGGAVRIAPFHARVLGASIDLTARVAHDDTAILDPELALDIRDVDLRTFARHLDLPHDPSGDATVSVRVAPGPEISVDVRGASLRALRRPVGEFVARATWRDGAIEVEEVSLVSRAGDLRVSGRVPLDLSLDPPGVTLPEDGPLSLRVRSNGIRLGSLRLAELGVRAAGRLTADLAVAGSVSHPVVRGDVSLEAGRLRMSGLPPVDKLEMVIGIETAAAEGGVDRVLVRKLTGKFGSGTLEASGAVEIREGKPEMIDLAVIARNIDLVRQSGLRLRSDLDLTFRGNPDDRMRLAGRVGIRSLRYTEKVRLLLTAMQSRPSLAPLPLTTDPMLARIDMDLVVDIPRGSARVQLEGRLRVGGNLAIPRPDGVIRVHNGKLFLPTVTMKTKTLSVGFRKAEPLRAHVNGALTARISGYDVETVAMGPVDDLEIAFSSQPPLPEVDVLSLITAGVTRNALGVESVGSAAANLLYREIASGLSGTGEDDSALAELARRVEVEVDPAPAGSGGMPTISATVRILGDWLLLRGGQDTPENYGLDVILRLSFK